MGMRQVIFGAPGLELVSAALFLAADGVAVCRPHIAGVATGAVTGACQPHWSIWNPAAARFRRPDPRPAGHTRARGANRIHNLT
jgi:hypothetical protein